MCCLRGLTHGLVALQYHRWVFCYLQTQIEQSTKRNYAWQVAVVAGVAGAVLVTFQGCGHLALFQEVDSFVALVDSFLAAQGSFQPQPASAYTCHGLGLSGSAP